MPRKTTAPIPQIKEVPLLTGPGAKLAKLTISLTELIAEETELLRQRLASERKNFTGEKTA
jgi:hypothetical protein